MCLHWILILSKISSLYKLITITENFFDIFHFKAKYLHWKTFEQTNFSKPLHVSTISTQTSASIATQTSARELISLDTKDTGTVPKKKPKNFKCTQCSQAYDKRKDLKFHMISVHENKREIKCEQCDFTTS